MGPSPPIFAKIVSENQKKSKKSFRSPTKSKQEKKSRLKSDFSNLVKKMIPGFRLFPDIILMDTIVCPPPSHARWSPFLLFPGHYSPPTSLPCSLPPSLVLHSSGLGDFALCRPPQTRHRMDTTLCLSAGVVRACKINHLRNALHGGGQPNPPHV